MEKLQILESRIESYKLNIEFLENDIKSSMEDVLYNKKMLSESNSIRDIEYYIEKIQNDINRIKNLELQKSMNKNFLDTLIKINDN